MSCATLSSSKRTIKEISAMSHLDVRNHLRQDSSNVLAVLTKKKQTKNKQIKGTLLLYQVYVAQ